MPLDFPNSPTAGQEYDRYKWNDTDSVWDLNLPEYIAVYEFEYLVIAGGGGGGLGVVVSARQAGGGGGAGGYLTSSLSLVSGTYSISVGAGGAGATSAGVSGTKGVNSVFSLVISEGGGFGARDSDCWR
jgi:hypothetical protein